MNICPGGRRRLRGLAHAITAMALAAAAGPAAADDGTPKACELLVEADIVAVLGAGYTKMQPQLGSETCVYQKTPTTLVALMVARAPEGADHLLVGRRSMFKSKIVPATELGAQAFFAVAPKGTALHFGKGAWVAQLEASEANGDPRRLLELGRRILARR